MARRRCSSVLEGKSPELYPVSIGVTDDDGCFHLVEASRTLSRQLHLWATSQNIDGMKVISDIQTVSLTHLHLGHIDGLGLFGREAMGKHKNVRLLASNPVMEELSKRSLLEPFVPHLIREGEKKINVGLNTTLEFHRVPHRDHEVGDTHAIVVRGESKSLLFCPDHDFWDETLRLFGVDSIRAWLRHLQIDIALLDGTFFTVEEVAGTRQDATGIPHPPISQTLEMLGAKKTTKKDSDEKDDPEIYFIHFNHTNPVIDDPEKQRAVTSLGWKLGKQGTVFYL